MSRFCSGAQPHDRVRRDVFDYCARCGLVFGWPPDPAPTPKVRPRPADARAASHARRVALLWERDGPGCFYCHRQLEPEQAVLDHYVPKSRGGSDALENRRVSCVPCDKLKADRMPLMEAAGD